MLKIVLTTLILLQLRGHLSQDDCSNLWDETSSSNICAVQTDNGNNCQFPFTYNGKQYTTCIIGGPNNPSQYPQCMTSSTAWANCLVPTNAIVTQVTTKKNGAWWQNGASKNGGTMLWISGRRFAENLFQTVPTTETSNQVLITNGVSTYTCEIHPDKVTSTQITCFTPAIPNGQYLVRVLVFGNLIPTYQYVSTSYAMITVSDSQTPLISSITPMNGPPGSMLAIQGDFKTYCYSRDIEGCSDDQNPLIQRVYFGGQLCNLIDPITNEIYGTDNKTVTQFNLTCKLTTSEINYYNATMLVSEDYGRSVMDPSQIFVSATERLYNFMTYPIISSISSNSGGVLGETILTITGQYFYSDSNYPAKIEIAGNPCEVTDYERNNNYDSQLVCKTPPKPTSSQSEYYGGLGVTVIRDNVYSATLSSATPSSSAVYSQLADAQYNDNNTVDVTVWLKGFFKPGKSSNYKFTAKSTGSVALYLSTDQTAANKVLAVSANNGLSSQLYLTGNKYYYFELIGSKQSGGLNISLNAIMYDTVLNDQLSSNVKNEIQDIKISSPVIKESFSLTSQNVSHNDSESEIQFVSISSPSGLPFIISYDGIYSAPLDFHSSQIQIQNALNDMPNFYQNLVTVIYNSSYNQDSIEFYIKFSSSLGDVSEVEIIGNVLANVTELVKGIPDGKMFQLVIENLTTPLINTNLIYTNVQSALDKSFGIRCPVGVQIGDSNSVYMDDFENSCQWSPMPFNYTAFCGKCSQIYTYDLFRPNNISVSLTNNYLCFAYNIKQRIQSLGIQITDQYGTLYTINPSINTVADNQWHYICLDVYKAFMDAQTSSNFPKATLTLIRAYVNPYYATNMFDVVRLGKLPPNGYDDPNLITSRRIYPNLQLFQNTLSVAQNSASKVTVSYRPINCSYNLQAVSIKQQFSQDEPITIASVSIASPPVTGSFDISWNGSSIQGVPANATDVAVKNFLSAIQGFGSATVTRSQDCAGFKWRVKWTNGGDKSQMSISNQNLAGNSPTIAVNNIQDGAAYFSPIRGDMLRTLNSKPQVVVTIADITASCDTNCNFEWLDSQTPAVDSIDTSNIHLLKITGSGFDSTPANNIVLIGSTPCTVSSATSTQLQCVPGNGPVGTYDITVNVANKGIARMNTAVQYEYQLSIDSFTPNSGGTGGGLILNVTGMCFSDNTLVTVDSLSCDIINATYSWITCTVPSNPTNANIAVNVIVKDGQKELTFSSQFNYDSDNTPTVSSFSPTTLSVLGGETITIVGTNLPTGLKSIYIGQTAVKVVSNTAQQIVIKSPKLNPGLYDLIIPAGSLGNAKVSSQLEYVFYVSSFTPNIGSIRGGTFVNIYGEGFSEDCSLNDVKFGDFECTITSCTKTSIQCQTGDAYTVHVIDNSGIDINYGLGYSWSLPYLKISQGEYVKWQWSAPSASRSVYKVEQVSDPSSIIGSGFSSGDESSSGSYVYQFTSTGTFYYWSGYVDVNNQIALRGIIEVQSGQDKDLAINVTQGGIQAQQCSFPFNYASTNYTACTNVDKGFNWCSPASIANGQYLKCDPLSTIPAGSCSSQQISSCGSQSIAFNSMRFTSSCSVPEIQSVSPLSISYDTEITIQGTDFSSNACENQVYIGQTLCNITSSSTSSLTCKIGKNSLLVANQIYDIKVLVKNIGFALQSDSFQIEFQPVIDTISSLTGSLLGGSKITISGDGFTGLTTVTLSNAIFYLTSSSSSLTYDQLSFVTNQNDHGVYNISVSVNNVPVEWRSSSSYEFSNAYTPVVNSVSPTQVSGSQEITIDGEGLSANTLVTIGNQTCQVVSANETQIICQLAGLDLGAQSVSLNVQDFGLARVDSSISVTGSPSLTAISPDSGSLNGGTTVTIAGNGFSSQTVVNIGNKPCNVIDVEINQIKCVSTANTEGNYSVSISVNGQNYPSGAIFFRYTSDKTPAISLISPTAENSINSILTISGSGFSDSASDINVIIGNSSCIVQQASTTEIKCQLGINRAGQYPVNLLVSPFGYANKDKLFSYNMNIVSLSNSQSASSGGLLLAVNGNGFSPLTSISICGNACKIVNSTQTQIYCTVPPSPSSSSDQTCTLIASDNSVQDTESFNYVVSITPSVSSVSPLRGGTGGGVKITITGTNFPSSMSDVHVTIAGSTCDLFSVDTTEIVCYTGSYAYSSTKALVQVYVNNVGVASNTNAYFEYIDLWSSPFTWGGDAPPGEGELVVINKGQTVYFDAQTPVLKGLLIVGGALIFDDNQDVNLQAEYIIIVDGGLLQVGTENAPFQHKATITMHGSVRSIELPIFGAKVIALRNGTIEMHGKPVGITWTYLGSTALAGATQITLKEPVSWPVGGQVVIATTGDKLSPGESEVRTIVAISSDKMTLTLDQALAFSHLSVKRTVSDGVGKTYDLYIQAEVGLLSRNVLYQGTSDPTWTSLRSAPACPDGFNPDNLAVQTCFLGRYGPEIGTDQFGAHIMASADMSMPHMNEPIIMRFSNVEFFHVGQGYRLGRYPIHFHMNGNSPSSYVKECAIHESFNRAVNIHGSHYINIERNVIYDIMGGAYFLEDGVEIGNSFKYNLAVFVKTSSSLLNEDSTPAAFWVTNPNNTIMHNAVAGGTHFGFWYRLLDNSDGPSFSSSYCPKKMPMGVFYNNSAHSCGRFGLWVFPSYTPSVSGSCWDLRPSRALFQKLYSYLNDKGAEWEQSTSLQFRDFTLFDHYTSGITTQTIRYVENVNSPYTSTLFNRDVGAVVGDSVIVGKSDPNAAFNTLNGIIVAWDRGLLVENVTFINFPNEDTQAMRAVEIICRCVVDCGGWTTQLSGLKFHNVKYRTLHRWDWDLVYKDLDGSLTGYPNGVVVYADNITTTKSNCQIDSAFKNAVKCHDTNNWIRHAYNKLNPTFVVITNVTNQAGQMAAIPMKMKRLTHGFGFMIALEAKQEYLFIYDEALFPTNVTYSSGFWDFKPSDYLIIKHQLSRKPDKVDFGTAVSFTSQEYNSPLNPNVNSNGDWHWDNDTHTLSYILINKDKPLIDYNIEFAAYKCRFANCEPPVSPALLPPVTARRPDYLNWSDPITWRRIAEPGWGGYSVNASNNNTLPVDGDSVKIPSDVYVVVDCPLPRLKLLQIEGILEFDNGIDHRLVTDMIFINGGQLIVGWENNPILTDVEIVLMGEKDALHFTLPDDVSMIGGKAIGVYGGLDLHGRPRHPTWTRLESTAYAGLTNITLELPVDWEIGEEIVITTTSYNANHSETRTIANKSADSRTLWLNSPLTYDHVAFSENLTNETNGKGAPTTSYKIAAGVGLLTRNVKIIGGEYPKQRADLYGSRIIVSDYSVVDPSSNFTLYYKGYARISNTEFVHPGQFSRNSDDDSKFGILYSDLLAYDYIRPSYVTDSSFHHGLGTAIGIFGSSSIPITNNVIYYTINNAMFIKGDSNIIRNNLIATNFWASTFLTWEAAFDIEYWGSVDVHLADSVVLENNMITGAERTGILLKGDLCEGQSLGSNYNHSIMNNTVHSSMVGVATFHDYVFKPSLPCIRLRNFTIFKSTYWAIYYQQPSSVVMESNILVDNGGGLFGFIIEPDPMLHDLSNKSHTIQNTLIVGQSESFDCVRDVKPDDLNYQSALTANMSGGGLNMIGKIGISWANFLGGTNMAPYKPWQIIKTYNAIGGKLEVKNVTFAHFGESCSGRDYAISTNKMNDDCQHPMTIVNSALVDVDTHSKVWIHRPNTDMINDWHCVDMDCDGLKKNILHDLDGSFLQLGEPGTVISQAEYDWGSQKRGVGDYRIPSEALAYPNGSMMPISQLYQHPGIVRDQQYCIQRDDWQAWECTKLVYKMLMIESMDNDTEKRRIAPIAIVSDNGYLDLINGPGAHSVCFGFSCQRRISTFASVIATNKSYDIYLSSTAPNQLRFRVLNSDPTFSVRLSVYYTNPNRIDVYVNDSLVPATNSYYQNGNMYLKDPSTNLASYMPSYSNATGTNLFIKADSKIYFTIRGGGYIDLKISPLLYLKFGMPGITDAQFFDPATIVQNFAALLNVDPSKIRQVNIVRATNTRKRRATSDIIYVELYVFENPAPVISDPTLYNALVSALNEIDANITNRFTTGQLNETAMSLFNVTLDSLFIQRVEQNTTLVEINHIESVRIITEPSGCREQSPCDVQPSILVLDKNGNPLTNIGNSQFKWTIEAELVNCTNPNATILFQSQAQLSANGTVNFEKFGISEYSDSCRVVYKIKLPKGVNSTTFDPMETLSKEFSTDRAQLACVAFETGLNAQINKFFSVSFQIVDAKSKTPVPDIHWTNITWSAAIQMFTLSSCQSNGTLHSNQSYATIDSSSATINFNDLYFTGTGMYILRAQIKSSDNAYDLKCYSNAILILATNKSLSINDNIDPNIILGFKADYDAIVSSGTLEHWKAKFHNCLIEKYGLIRTRSIIAYKGSLMINTGVDPTNTANTVTSLGNDITSGSFSSEFGLPIVSAQVMDRTLVSSDASASDGGGTNGGMIAGIVVGVVAFVALVPLVAFVVYKVYTKNKRFQGEQIFPTPRETPLPPRTPDNIMLHETDYTKRYLLD